MSSVMQMNAHKNRTTKKPAKFCVTPIKVATTPQAIVSVGSQNLGVVRFRMMLHGIYFPSIKALSRYNNDLPQIERNQ